MSRVKDKKTSKAAHSRFTNTFLAPQKWGHPFRGHPIYCSTRLDPSLNHGVFKTKNIWGLFLEIAHEEKKSYYCSLSLLKTTRKLWRKKYFVDFAILYTKFLFLELLLCFIFFLKEARDLFFPKQCYFEVLLQQGHLKLLSKCFENWWLSNKSRNWAENENITFPSNNRRRCSVFKGRPWEAC